MGFLSVCLEPGGPDLPSTAGTTRLGGPARWVACQCRHGRRIGTEGVSMDGKGLEGGSRRPRVVCDWRRYLGSTRNLSLLATALDHFAAESSRTACGCRNSCSRVYQGERAHTRTHTRCSVA